MQREGILLFQNESDVSYKPVFLQTKINWTALLPQFLFIKIHPEVSLRFRDL